VPTQEHQEIIKAIRLHNPEAARKSMHDHISQSKDKVLRLTMSPTVRS